jgi:CrcB protein
VIMSQLSIVNIFLLGSGGAVGAMLRAALLRMNRTRSKLPYMTLILNTVGSFALGALWAWSRDSYIWLWLGTGVLGGFTTYSTFTLEVEIGNRQAETKPYMLYYIFATLVFSMLAAGLGAVIVKHAI